MKSYYRMIHVPPPSLPASSGLQAHTTRHRRAFRILCCAHSGVELLKTGTVAGGGEVVDGYVCGNWVGVVVKVLRFE